MSEIKIEKNEDELKKMEFMKKVLEKDDKK
jgi:hypothetical protein